jgi:hypothetical protein
MQTNKLFEVVLPCPREQVQSPTVRVKEDKITQDEYQRQ